MRISPILSLRDLPLAELQAGVLDGELFRVGSAFCAIDTIMSAEHRAESIATEVPERSIAERFTAAWVYGVFEEQPHPLQLCVTAESNLRPISSTRCLFREVVIGDEEIAVIGGLPVTRPLRTALDLARIDIEYSTFTAQTVLQLSTLGQGFDFAECEAAMNGRRNLPNKRLALERLSDTFQKTRRPQPALTR